MNVDFSKEFSKALDKLSGKIHNSVVDAINDAINNVIDAATIDDIANCRKIETLKNVYRIKIGSKRAFFVLHIHIQEGLVKFEYLVSRGEAYNKKNMERLKKRDIEP